MLHLPVVWVLLNTAIHRPGVSYIVLKYIRTCGWLFQCSFNEGGRVFNFHIRVEFGKLKFWYVYLLGKRWHI